PVLLRVRLPAGERPRLLLALRHFARARRALLSLLWSTRSRLIGDVPHTLTFPRAVASVPLGVPTDLRTFERRRSPMRYTVQLTVAAAAAVAGALLLACGEGTAPSSQQAQVLAAEQEQLGAMVHSDFGPAGAAGRTGAGRLQIPRLARAPALAPGRDGRGCEPPDRDRDGREGVPQRYAARGGHRPGGPVRRHEPRAAVPAGGHGEGGRGGHQHDQLGVHPAELPVPACAACRDQRNQLASPEDDRQRRWHVRAQLD